MQKAVIVIPVYKNEPSESEKASLKQCIKILGKYPIKFVCPENLDIKNYEKLFEGKECDFSFKSFDKKYFESLISYSKLLLDKNFYKRFIDYEFMLIYQLDAWVFEDKLEYWCEQNYDYIGAPWFEGCEKANENSPLMPVAGNGGFSLRKITSIIKLLSVNYKIPEEFQEIYNKNKKNSNFFKHLNTPICLFQYLTHPSHYIPFWKITDMYEDFVIVMYGPKAYKNFNLAPPEVALQFSFETQPRRLYEMNNKKLPFGCHAWEKYDNSFWDDFIR